MITIGLVHIRARLVNESLDRRKEILQRKVSVNLDGPYVKDNVLTFSVSSIIRTSPVIRDSEKSTFAFHNCVKNASRSWRAVYFCRISCGTPQHVVSFQSWQTRDKHLLL